MDTSLQLDEIEATGWQRGVYDDIKRTFRAPFVNWIFRTTMANHSGFLRYAWFQVKPTLDTRAFARYTIEFRDAVLSELEAEFDLPAYTRRDVGVRPAEYREIRGQVATFDLVGPRLAVLFETMDRALHGEPVGENPAEGRAVTAPFPEWLDADRGAPPTMVEVEEIPAALEETVSAIRRFHGFEEDLPSVYRCLAQWPGLLEALWADLEPAFESTAFDRACEAVAARTDEYVDATPFRPRLAPDDLRGAGFDAALVEDVQGLFREFNTGAVGTVLPALPVYAAAVDAGGPREVP